MIFYYMLLVLIWRMNLVLGTKEGPYQTSIKIDGLATVSQLLSVEGIWKEGGSLSYLWK